MSAGVGDMCLFVSWSLVICWIEVLLKMPLMNEEQDSMHFVYGLSTGLPVKYPGCGIMCWNTSQNVHRILMENDSIFCIALVFVHFTWKSRNILVADYVSHSYKFHVTFCLHMKAFLFFDSIIVMKSIVQAEIKIELFRSLICTRFMQQHHQSF
jgi:hypothetical protein